MREPELSRSVRLPQRGFSLVEMLVAMVILSLSLGVLYQAAAGAIRNARVSGEYTEAVILADIAREKSAGSPPPATSR